MIKSRCEQPGCDGSGDNKVVYENGSTFCFACGAYTFSDTDEEKVIDPVLLPGTVQALPRRGISQRTCRFFDYLISSTGEHIANYRDKKGIVVGQKIRGPEKAFTARGSMKDPLLYGQWLYAPSDNVFITITEGEIDTLTVAEVCGLQYPVVSLPTGASAARKSLERALAWLSGFKHVVLAFDNDRAGIRATEECLDLFEPGKVKVAQWPLKDANEMLLAGRGQEIKSILFNAKDSYENHLVTMSDLLDEILIPPQMGVDFPFESLTKMTYGFRPHELYIFVGPNSVGKTELMKEIMFHFLDQDVKIGLFSFEQRASSSGQRLIGAKLNRRLHLPGEEWDLDAIQKEAKDLDNKIFFCKNAGSRTIKQICNDIRYWSKAKGVKLIIIDNMKGLARGMSNENLEVKQAMLEFQALVQELDISIFLISHVSKDKFSYSTYISTSPKNEEAYLGRTAEEMNDYTNKPGLSWESGRMATKENVEGSSSVCDLADYVFALARDTTNKDTDISSILRVKCLKARLDGGYTGHTFKLQYTNDGRLVEQDGGSVNTKALFYE